MYGLGGGLRVPCPFPTLSQGLVQQDSLDPGMDGAIENGEFWERI